MDGDDEETGLKQATFCKKGSGRERVEIMPSAQRQQMGREREAPADGSQWLLLCIFLHLAQSGFAMFELKEQEISVVCVNGMQPLCIKRNSPPSVHKDKPPPCVCVCVCILFGGNGVLEWSCVCSTCICRWVLMHMCRGQR